MSDLDGNPEDLDFEAPVSKHFKTYAGGNMHTFSLS